MESLKKEFWVGLFVLLVLFFMGLFGWLMGVIRPFGNDLHFDVLYAFAGGIDQGSPVRVSGIKVGKVDSIDFLPQLTSDKMAGANLRVRVSVSKKASHSVRQDSKFYVNMAGVIGERYIEISPGGTQSSELQDGAEVRGIDPPRIDQLISQGYGVFGKIQDFIDQNEETLQDFIAELSHLLQDSNKLLKGREGKRVYTLIDNLAELTGELKNITKDLTAERNEKFFEEIRELVHRAHEIDKPAVKKFFQEEGIKTKIF